jgi:hypothetical protein
MSATAWTALADRFAALAAEQEFQLRTYSTDDWASPPDRETDRFRFRFYYHFGGPASAPTELAVVIGAEADRHAEFDRINRLRWLSWSAGLLLGPDAYTPPELHWWRHVRSVNDQAIRPGPDGKGTTLSELVRRSAEVARRLSEPDSDRPTPQPSIVPGRDNWPRIQTAFRSLRDRFNSPTWETEHVNVVHAAFPDYQAYDRWNRRDVHPFLSSITGGYQEKAAHGTVWGYTREVEGFVRLAETAANQLPLELRFTPPLFPWFNPLGNDGRPGPGPWLEFLFVVCPTAFTQEHDWPVRGSRIARLSGSPFFAATNAIDRLLLEDSRGFVRHFRENVAHLNPWFGDEDRVAAVAAVEASFLPVGMIRPDRTPGAHPMSETSVSARAAFDRAHTTALAALRAVRGLRLSYPHRDNPNWHPPYQDQCDGVGELIEAARSEVGEVAHWLRGVTQFKADRPYCGRFAASAHEAAVDAASCLLSRLLPVCGDPGEMPEDRVYAELERDVEQEYAAAVTRLLGTASHPPEAFIVESTPPVQPGTNTPGGYTLQDIRDLLRYKRETASFEARRRATEKPRMSPMEAPTHTHWCAINCPQPGRLTEERAASLAVYRRLVRAARADYHTELDVATLGLLVADVADRAGAAVESLMRMPLDEFGRLWGADPPGQAGGPTSGTGKPPKHRRRPGRPSDTDHARDRRISEAWDTGRYTNLADLAREFGLPGAKAAERAIDRHRKRIERARVRGDG